MKKQLLACAISRSFLLIAGLLLMLGLSSFREMPPKKVKSDFSLHHFSNDPIRFRMTANKKQIFADEEIEITITAYYTPVSPALLYTIEGANSFRLKVVPPEGFVQTGGDYIDYCGATLTTDSPVARYTLKGYFPRLDVKPLFRLLRGNGQADANSLFVVKDELTLEVRPAPRRSAESLAEATPPAPEPVVQSAARAAFSDCSFDPNTPIISWYGEQIYARQHNGVWYAAYADGSNFKPQSWVLATGFANYQCFAQTDPRTNGGNTNSGNTSNNSGCSFDPNTPIIQWYGEQIYARQFNGVWYAAYGDGSNFKPQSWVLATGFANYQCFAQTDPRTNGGSTSNGGTTNSGNTGSGCSFDPNTPIISWYGEQIYARQHNGIWYAAYGDGSNFKPQSWVLATGFANYQCFAQTDPRTSSGGNANNQGSNTPNSTGPCSVSRPRACVDILNGNGVSGWALDEGDFNKTLTIEIYVNGVKVASGPANEDRSDLVGAFGNNPSARYHGFHAQWQYNRQGTTTCTIMVKICGVGDPLKTEQIVFQIGSNPNARQEPLDGGTLPEVTVRAESINGSGPNWTGWGGGSFNSNSGSSGTGGSNDGSGSNGGGGGSGSGGPGANTLVPYNAPTNPNTGQVYESPYTGKKYIWDGSSWVIILVPAEVKGTPPANPTTNQIYFYVDPNLNSITTYTFFQGFWTQPLPGRNMNNQFKQQLDASRQHFCQQAERIRSQYSNTPPNWAGPSNAQSGVEGALLRAFVADVKNGAPFDLKAHGYSEASIGKWSNYDGQILRFDDYGNINFGYAAAATGIPLSMAVCGAGVYQWLPDSGPVDFSNFGGCFDDRRDTAMIKMGYNLFKGCNN